MENKGYISYIEDIVKLSSELTNIFREEMKESIENARFEEEEDFLNRVYSNIISSNEKMLNNAITLSLLNGKTLQYDGNDYKKASIFTIEINGVKYNIKKEDLQNILGKEFNKTIDDLVNRKPTITKNIHNTLEKEVRDKKSTEKETLTKEPGKNKKPVVKENKSTKVVKDNKKNRECEKSSVPSFSLKEIEDEYNDILLDDKPVLSKEKEPDITITGIQPNIKQNQKASNSLQKEKAIKSESLVKNLVSMNENDLITKEQIAREPQKIKDLDNTELFDETELVIIDDDNLSDSKTIEKEKEISPNDMIIDDYTLEYKNKDKSIVKTISIIVTPLHLELEDCFMTQIMVLAKCGNEIKAFVSDDINRPSVQVKIDSESLIIRGSWVDGNFQTILYPQNNGDFDIVKKIKTIRPEVIYNCGHNINIINDDIIHIVPLASQNNENGYVGIIVCLENKKNNLYKIEKSSHTKITEIGSYKISAKWENGKLISRISDI